MYIVGRDLKDSGNCIPKVFFRYFEVPIRIWQDGELVYFFYEGVIYDVKGRDDNAKNKRFFAWLGRLINKIFRGIITRANNRANIFKILT